MNTITELKKGQELGTEVRKHPKVLVDFSAKWCSPCKTLAAMFEKMRKEGKLPANVIKVDVEEHPKLAERYRLDGVPAIMLFVEGKPKAMTSGLMGDYAQTVRRFTRMVEGGLSPD